MEATNRRMSFCVILVSKALLARENDEMLEKVVFCRRNFSRVWSTVEIFISQLSQLFCCHQRNVRSDVVTEDYAFSDHQCRVNLRQFGMDFVELLTALMRCDGAKAGSCGGSKGMLITKQSP